MREERGSSSIFATLALLAAQDPKAVSDTLRRSSVTILNTSETATIGIPLIDVPSNSQRLRGKSYRSASPSMLRRMQQPQVSP